MLERFHTRRLSRAAAEHAVIPSLSSVPVLLPFTYAATTGTVWIVAKCEGALKLKYTVKSTTVQFCCGSLVIWPLLR